ncbi:type VI secretion system membrane subunit TssM [Vibrio fluminensis]|uniref:type VI secretion system membrane subunit TssM n=1 Tax=Vibrio fluminensis TaxID=2783614 RepID=UPI00188777BD|nr:type VI secretion system membrane subunit TssM [Vibrio fluminensis]
MLRYIFRIVRALKPSVTAALPILLFITFVLVNIAIWWAGPWLEVGDKKPLETVISRVVACGLFTLGSLAIWGVLQWHKLQGYKNNQVREEQLRDDPIKILEERQETELNLVMSNMKESMGSANYLYSLPWYLVLGLENAGKTSLINRSGQNFTFSSVMRASGQKSGNPYSFDWWVGEDSVLIDPDGELLTQGTRSDSNNGEMERRLWLHFVKWLEKTRSRRPLNGIVLALDISHLATATTSERKAYASLLRARVKELTETLSTRVPVYITLTKLDLLYGFEPFFKHYNKTQREEVLGFTFAMDSVNNPDFWLEELMVEYGEFVERINGLLPHATSTTMSLDERNAIYSFTRQIAGIKDILHLFLQEALASDQYSIAALVRGVYFTSVYQQGVPTNAFDDAASRRYGLSHAINTAQRAKNSTVYFTEKLFTNIIYPEAGIASDNSRVAKGSRRVMGLCLTVCLIVTALLIGTWHQNYLKNFERSDNVLAKVNQYKTQFEGQPHILSQKQALDPLNQIREAMLEFGYFREKAPYVTDFGLYQGHTIGPKVEETYLGLLKTQFLPLLMAELVNEMNLARTDEEKLSALRIYRMLVDRSGRHEDFIYDYFSRSWQRSFSGQKRVQEQLYTHLEYALNHTNLQGERLRGDATAEQILRPYDLVISRAQMQLSAMPIAERVYRNLKLNSQSILGPSASLRSLVGPVFDVVFAEDINNVDNYYIPQLLTKKGFEEYLLPKSEEVSELALIDTWVLGLAKTAQFSEADKQALQDDIRRLYVADYTQTWRSAINELDIKYFNDINEAVAVLDNITSSTEPMQRLLRTLNTNTHLFANLAEDSEAQKALLKTSKYQVASQIEAPFTELNDMLRPVGGKPAYIMEVLASVEDLKNYMAAIKNAPDVGMAALEATKARTKLINADPIYTLNRISSGLPAPLDRMFAKLANESWFVVKQEALQQLEIRWSEDVYRPFQAKLAGRYPFKQNARKDVSLKDFESFFAPNGRLDRFYNEQLKLFVEEKIPTTEGQAQQPLIRPAILAQIQQARKIREAFFNRKGVLDVSFSVEPLSLTSNKRRSLLNIDGQFLTYSHGPRETVELIWPNTLRDSAVSKVTLIPTKSNRSPRSVQLQGPWAFFRLLDQAAVTGASPTSVDYKFKVAGGEMVYRINSEADANPFTERLFKSFRLSRALY